jgi:hypothetical protein
MIVALFRLVVTDLHLLDPDTPSGIAVDNGTFRPGDVFQLSAIV